MRNNTNDVRPTPVLTGSTPDLDEVDTKIVTALHADGRMSNTEVARRLGLVEGTVRKRIARLLRDGVIQFQAWVDPLKIGYDIYAIIEIQVHPPEIERVADRLSRFQEIAFLGIATGAFDIFAAAVFRSRTHLYDFLTKRLNQVPGIERTSTSNIIRIVKREYSLQLVTENATEADHAAAGENAGDTKARDPADAP